MSQYIDKNGHKKRVLTVVSTIGLELFQNLVNRSITAVRKQDLNGLTSIGKHAFRDCRVLQTVVLPNSVTSIEKAAFYDCVALRDITLSVNLTNIEGETFGYCVCLERITLPETVTNIGQSVFTGCTHMQSITILASNPPILANASAFFSSNNYPIYVPAESIAAYQSATNWSSLASRIQAIPE